VLAPPTLHETAEARLRRFLNALDPNFVHRLTDDDKQAINDAFGRAFPVTSAMDVRFSFRWFFMRVIVGRERRSVERRREDRMQFPALTVRNLPLLILLWVTMIVLSLVAIRVIPPLMVGLFF
jgi:hypothetical protein